MPSRNGTDKDRGTSVYSKIARTTRLEKNVTCTEIICATGMLKKKELDTFSKKGALIRATSYR